MVQKHIIVSMIAPVALAGILIMGILANQTFAYNRSSSSSVKCKTTQSSGKCYTVNKLGNFGVKTVKMGAAKSGTRTGKVAEESTNNGKVAEESTNNGKVAEESTNNGKVAEEST